METVYSSEMLVQITQGRKLYTHRRENIKFHSNLVMRPTAGKIRISLSRKNVNGNHIPWQQEKHKNIAREEQTYRYTSASTVCVTWRAVGERRKVNNRVARERNRKCIPHSVGQVD
jgi:hypothetical protein